MKSKIALLIGLLTLNIFLPSYAAPGPQSKDIVIALTNVFIPAGFDSTSDAYVVVNGIFPNGCYKWKGASRKDINKFEHEITSVATVSQGMCIQVLVPFTTDVRLGQLDTGKHTLRFLSNDGTYLEKNLVVE